MKLLVSLLCLVLNDSVTDAPRYESEQIFPVVEKQTHAPGIVELANGDLLASWYGDDEDSDAAVFGARKSKSNGTWSAPFVMADRPGFPDCNTCMMVDSKSSRASLVVSISEDEGRSWKFTRQLERHNRMSEKKTGWEFFWIGGTNWQQAITRWWPF